MLLRLVQPRSDISKLIKFGTQGARRHVTFRLSEVAICRALLADILRPELGPT